MSETSLRPRIVVVGSINLDLVARVARLPRPGETVTGRSLVESHGGKGANQAVAAARLGAAVAMIGRLGDDGFGASLRKGLEHEGIDTSGVLTTPRISSGVALIGVDDAGQNAITIVPGANGRLTPADVARHAEAFDRGGVLVVQLEVPIETVAAAIAAARKSRMRTVLDPAPAPNGPLPPECLAVDVLSPNQTEAEALTGIAVNSLDAAHDAAARLQELGARAVVLKLGEQGAYVLDASENSSHVPAPAVTPVDTTAAGDAFTAALAVRLAEGASLDEAVRFGCAAGALAVTREGAQAAMPSRAEVENCLFKQVEARQ
jgi:ribokinase